VSLRSGRPGIALFDDGAYKVGETPKEANC
jgi:hypothetical protein